MLSHLLGLHVQKKTHECVCQRQCLLVNFDRGDPTLHQEQHTELPIGSWSEGDRFLSGRQDHLARFL